MIAGNPAKVINTIENVSNKLIDKAFNFGGANFEKRKKIILENKESWIVR